MAPRFSAARRSGVAVLVTALLASMLGVVAAAPASAAASVGLAKDGPETVLVGGGGTFELTATNSGDAPAYNVSFRDVLPAGVTYTAGSTSPSTLGEPTVIANKPATGQTTLIWDNVFDINPPGSATVSYDVTTSSVTLPVGARFTNTATAYWSSDVRDAPSFTADGAFIPEPNITAGTAVPETTTVTALEVTKSEPSPENELVRGIHGSNGTTYTITVTNNGIQFTNGVTVTDYLPASLEFLQCGGVDNTNGSYVEYAGAPRLTSTTAPSGICGTPTSVETVTNPAGKPAGVYTKVTWSVGNLSPGGSTTFTYRAGIPLQQNTATFVGRPGVTPLDPQPSPTCSGVVCPQAANLDNNTGASTVETGTEASATNYVEAAGSYQGNGVDGSGNPITGPLAVTAQDTETVTIEDLAMRKSVSPTTFTQGGTATYTVTLRTSEYRSSSSIVVTDVLPDGMTYEAGSVSGATLTAGPTVNVDGTTSLTFSVAGILAAASTATFTYRATMDAAYKAPVSPTVAGDDYTNDARLTGTTTPIAGVDVIEPDTQNVTDASDATITSGGSTLLKTVGQDRTNTNCSAQTYSTAVPTAPFQVGDVVCFRLRVDFNDGSSTRNAFVQDFLPAGLTYESGSATTVTGNTVASGEIDFSASGTNLTWLLGTPQGGANRYLDRGEVFVVQFAAKVTEDEVGTAPDVTGNLMKTGSVNTAGQATTGRDQQDITLAGSQVDITKGVSRIVSVSGTTNYSPPKDGLTVRGGDEVTFSVIIQNTGVVPVRNLVIGDDLFDGITCAAVSAISDAGSCGAGTSPATGRLDWSFDDDVELAPGDKFTLTYVVTIPVGSVVDTRFDDIAEVVSYEAESNQDVWTVVSPVDVTDPSWVVTPKVEIAKTGVTGFEDAANNNNLPNQFTEGETIAYTVDIRVPIGTTVAEGSTLTDLLPAELMLLDSTDDPSIADAEVLFSALNDPADLGPVPDGTTLTLDTQGGRDRLRVTLPAGFDVDPDAATPALFRLTFTALLDPADIGTGDHGKRIRNIATFTGGPRAQYDAFVVLPNPLLSKVNTAPADTTSVEPGTPVTFTITATNPAGSAALKRTALYESTLTDVIPTGVIVDAASITGPDCEIAGASPSTGGGTITCDVGTLDSNETVTITYSAEVVEGALGSLVYVNTATLTGETLPDSAQVGEPPYFGTYTRTDTSVIRTYDGILEKSVEPDVATIGQQTAWTVTWQTGGASFEGPVLVDTLPVQGGAQALTSVSTGTVTCDPVCTGVTWTPVLGATAITWTATGTVAANTTVTFPYTAVVADVAGTAASDVLINSARVNSGEPAQAALEVVEPDLSLAKSVDPADPVPGEAYSYTITVTNQSNAPGESTPVGTAYNVTITDEVDEGIIIDVDSVEAGGGTCTDCDQTDGGGTISWPDVDPIAPGGTQARTYEARLKSSLTEGEYENVARVPSYTSCDPDNDVPPELVCVTDGRTYGPLDDVAIVSPGIPEADLAIVKTPNGSTTPGSDWTFTLQVSNLGPSDAEGAIVVTDTLPAGLTFLSSGAGWECDPNGQVVTCTLEPLDPEPVGLAAEEDAAPLAITVRTAANPSNAAYTNVATVESTTTEDPNLDNNTSQATVTVAPIPIPPPPNPDPDPEKPVDPVDPEKPVDPPTDPDPQEPGEPTITVQKPTRPIKPPTTIQPDRPTVVLPGTVTTNAGQKVRVDVRCRPLRAEMDKTAVTFSGRLVPMGDVRFCDVKRTKKGKVTVTVSYPGPVLVKVTYSAKKVPGYSAYKKVKRYVVVPR
jgi:uncharacterized repeat protein (TIGR01451 family)/fimbrial isopeptide formation D2 family protein